MIVLLLVLSQEKNINKGRAGTTGNVTISQTSSGNPNLIDSIQEVISSVQIFKAEHIFFNLKKLRYLLIILVKSHQRT